MEEKDRKLIRMLGVLSTVGLTMVFATVIGLFIGLKLDPRLGTSPWLTATLPAPRHHRRFQEPVCPCETRARTNLMREDKDQNMTDEAEVRRQAVAAILAGVAKKTALDRFPGAAAALACFVVRGDGALVVASRSASCSAVFWGCSTSGGLQSPWSGSTSGRAQRRELSNLAAVIISILKLSLIFIILFIVIKWQLLHVFGLVAGLSLCFLAILWQGATMMKQGYLQRFSEH